MDCIRVPRFEISTLIVDAQNQSGPMSSACPDCYELRYIDED